MDISIFTALAEPNRMRIIETLRDESPLTVGSIAERVGIRQPQASKHLHVLSEAGLVEVQAEANRRYYKLRAQPFQAMEAWLNTYRQIWEERFDNLDQYLKEMQQNEDKTQN